MSTEIKKRSEIDDAYKWHLEDIYAGDELAKADLDRIRGLASEIAGFKGRLADSAETILKCLELSDRIELLFEKVYCYARMHRDEDGSVPQYQELTGLCGAVISEVSPQMSFITPELIGIPDDVMNGYLASDALKPYAKKLEYILRTRAHVLSKEQEMVLAATAEAGEAPSEIFNVFTNTNMPFPDVTDEDGQPRRLSQGRYISFLESADRRVRQEAFDKMYATYGQYNDTFAAMMNYNCRNLANESRIRGYGSSIEASLFGDDVPTAVYDRLIDVIHANLPSFHRYLDLRRRVLGVDRLHMYDLYVPLVKSDIRDIPYEKACGMVLEGLAPLGSDYADLLRQAFKGGWIDVFENTGKRSGAYSWGPYGTHPYVCLNYQGSINDVCTIAHELGHSMHTYLTNATQPYTYSQYTLFVAEVASTVNEVLLLTDMISKASDPAARAFLINHYLEECRGTLFRQTMFAEFEREIHKMSDSGIPLTAAAMNEIYYDLNRVYFGDNMEVDDAIKYEWSRIPHFYRNFYVYKYATGFSAANALAGGILQEGAPALERYFGFLRSGCSDYPLNLLRSAGVDMSDPAPVQATCDRFAKMLDELEAAIG